MIVRGLDAFTGEAIEVESGQGILRVDSLLAAVEPDVYLAPGWIDVQVNGFANVDYNDPNTPQEEIDRSLRVLFKTGVTRFFPTVITNSQESMEGSLRNLARAKETLPRGGAMEAFHVEGPHISPEDGPRGAHPRHHVRPPSLEEFRRLQDAAQGFIRLVTVSPEWPEAPRFIEALVRQGVVASIGHTKATPEQVGAAVSAGATMSTHLGNGAHSTLPKFPNYIWQQMADDRLTAGFIVDGIHLNDAFLTVALRAKGIERSVLVTDAVMPAGCPPGRYRLGELDVELHPDLSVRLVGQDRLAGSSLEMDRGINNLLQRQGLSLAAAVTMSTKNPARVCRVANRHRGLTPGDRGDLVKFRFHSGEKRIEILETYLAGEQVYRAA